MSLRKVLFAAVGGLVLLTAAAANAAVFVNEEFTHSDGSLDTVVPTPGPGIAWFATSNRGTNPIQVASGMAVVQHFESGNSEDLAARFDEQSAIATTYARFDFSLPSADNAAVATDPEVAGGGLYFVALRGSGASELRARTGIRNAGAAGDFRLAINASSGDLDVGAAWASDLMFDTTYRAVISYNASNAESRLWLDPVDENSTSISHIGAITGTLIDRFMLRQHTTYDGKQLVDNLVVATSFADALNPPGAGVPGDYNGNSIVDAADYTVWRDSLGQLGAGLPADGVADMVIDSFDYDFWKSNFGSSGAGVGSAAAVPEPSVAWLAVVGLVLMAAIPRRPAMCRVSIVS